MGPNRVLHTVKAAPPRAARLRQALADDRGAGSVLALAVTGVVIALAGAELGLMAAFSAGHHARADADAAALAAADVASGLVAGVPCEAAARAADLGGSILSQCSLSGEIATTRVYRMFAGVVIEATARAGPGPQSLQTRPP